MSSLSRDIIDNWLAGQSTWTLSDSNHLVRVVRTDSYPTAVAVIATQIDLAEELDHHPLITLGPREVRLELWTHSVDALTEKDLEYAGRFDALVEKYYAAKIS